METIKMERVKKIASYIGKAVILGASTKHSPVRGEGWSEYYITDTKLLFIEFFKGESLPSLGDVNLPGYRGVSDNARDMLNLSRDARVKDVKNLKELMLKEQMPAPMANKILGNTDSYALELNISKEALGKILKYSKDFKEPLLYVNTTKKGDSAFIIKESGYENFFQVVWSDSDTYTKINPKPDEDSAKILQGAGNMESLNETLIRCDYLALMDYLKLHNDEGGITIKKRDHQFYLYVDSRYAIIFLGYVI